MVERFVSVLVPRPLPAPLTYRLPEDWAEVPPGCRVLAPLGKQVLTGVVWDGVPPAAQLEKKDKARDLIERLDESPILPEKSRRLVDWVAKYYACAPGEVLLAALPTGLRLSQSSYVRALPQEAEPEDLTARESTVWDFLKDGRPLQPASLAKLLGQQSAEGTLASLQRKGLIEITEEIQSKYRPLTELRLRIAPSFQTEDALNTALESLSRAPKAEAALLSYLQRIPLFESPASNKRGVPRQVLLDSEITPGGLETLVKKGIFEKFEATVPRFPHLPKESSLYPLSPAQAKAKAELGLAWKNQPTALLHGVTGSGKTEVYLELIQEVIESGKEALFLLPEIALTTQIVQRLRARFGERFGIYHSKFSDAERAEVYLGLLEGKFKLVVGVRSAMFLPFNNLGLIVVDEEHDSSYKQQDPAPRYQARDAAQVLAQLHGAKVLLGSATPAIETLQRTTEGLPKINLLERFGKAKLPEIKLVRLSPKPSRLPLAEETQKAIEETLAAGKQAILFQNRRGYAPYLLCGDCHHIPQCPHCDVSLTYHQHNERLICHYCGHSEPTLPACPSCGSTSLHLRGLGTEQLEEVVQERFPTARIARMDADTTRARSAFDRLLDDFGSGRIDILVGTQMVTKGLDFEGVSLVVVLDADTLLHFPSFRAHERGMQLLLQVAGRAGRKETGRVLIQTVDPTQDVLRRVLTHDYLGFAEKEIDERRTFLYPPFARLVQVMLRHEDRGLVESMANRLANRLKEALGSHRILGPEPPLVAWVRNQYRFQVLIKLEKGEADPAKAKAHLLRLINEVKISSAAARSVYISIDVDPYL